jgi:hypothetical protein
LLRAAAAGARRESASTTNSLAGVEWVRARLKAWPEAGVDTVRFYPSGDTPTARLNTLARGIDLVRALG